VTGPFFCFVIFTPEKEIEKAKKYIERKKNLRENCVYVLQVLYINARGEKGMY
jgi:hypothetical protein